VVSDMVRDAECSGIAETHSSNSTGQADERGERAYPCPEPRGPMIYFL